MDFSKFLLNHLSHFAHFATFIVLAFMDAPRNLKRCVLSNRKFICDYLVRVLETSSHMLLKVSIPNILNRLLGATTNGEFIPVICFIPNLFFSIIVIAFNIDNESKQIYFYQGSAKEVLQGAYLQGRR